MKKFFSKKDIFSDHGSYFQGKEKEFEQILKRNLGTILNEKSSKVLNFSLSLYSGYGSNVKPDLILIKKDYSGFIVIEVETEFHSLRGHVLPQIKKLVDCDYYFHTEKIYKHLCNVNKTKINKLKFKNMLRDHEPNFCVVSNRYSPKWDKALSDEGFDFLAVAPYINSESEYSFYVKYGNKSHELERINIEWDSHCFILKDPTRSKLKVNKTYDITIDGNLFSFYVSNEGDKYFLFPSGVRLLQNVFRIDQIESMKILRYSNKYMEISL